METEARPSQEAAGPGVVDHGQDITQLLDDTLERLATRAAGRTYEPGEAGTDDAEKESQPSLGDLVDALDERAFGLLLLILALPCCIPLLWGIPQIVALPMLATAGQIAGGREHPWLPGALANRRFDARYLQGKVRGVRRYIGWAERFAKPRLTALTEGIGLRVVGALLMIPCASILVPLPSTNTAPGIGVAVASVGLLERDGLLVLLGLLFGLAWVVFLVTITILLGAEATSIVKGFILGRD